jgi:hypothetical protein
MGAINAGAGIHTEASVEANMLRIIIYLIICKFKFKQSRNNIYINTLPPFFSNDSKYILQHIYAVNLFLFEWLVECVSQHSKAPKAQPKAPKAQPCSHQLKARAFMQFINHGSPKYMTQQVGRSIHHRCPKCMTKFLGGPDEIYGES